MKPVSGFADFLCVSVWLLSMFLSDVPPNSGLLEICFLELQCLLLNVL